MNGDTRSYDDQGKMDDRRPKHRPTVLAHRGISFRLSTPHTTHCHLNRDHPQHGCYCCRSDCCMECFSDARCRFLPFVFLPFSCHVIAQGARLDSSLAMNPPPQNVDRQHLETVLNVKGHDRLYALVKNRVPRILCRLRVAGHLFMLQQNKNTKNILRINK